ncbi:alpha/beta hydrolase [Burkholderia glumae]|uniref:alpha/beta fold hydrolase n=1 Tax=Burkholderia glumae TaxID=337 RepID=UPI000F5FE294|nr:alpha/beta fold hydrolase [Burkholderia glumae]MCQ0029783.1 alpha/beta hydrolase [Burkholderia glumae]MCQ0040224.1 alpha/beta hydrolase [Burkholderia glumae]QJW77675.1 alpha/beta hydrolase [Burkholderia glumae]RQZ73506.1 alpha/beta hydrolase [Burkholderia glumae]UVS87156.1 alpha/beta hydrolase [Burkholderia glumae]
MNPIDKASAGAGERMNGNEASAAMAARPAPNPFAGRLPAEVRGFEVLAALDALRAREVTASDGTPLAAYEAGARGRPTVLVCNALGVSVAFVAPLVARLAADYHVVGWEARGLPASGSAAGAEDLSLARHARDAAEVLAALGGGDGTKGGAAVPHAFALVAYCAGSNVAAQALAEDLVTAGRLVLLSPSIELPGVADRTPYQASVLPLWDRIAGGAHGQAALVRVLLGQARRADDGTPDGQLAILNALPFVDDASIVRYARLQHGCRRDDWAARLAGLGLPALVLHGAQDEVIHAATSRAVAGALGAALQIVEAAGHFAVHTSRDLHERIAAFLKDAGEAGGKRHLGKE